MINVGFIGFGEAAQSFWSGWKDRDDVEAIAYDIKLDDAEHSSAMQAALREQGVKIATSGQQVCLQSHLVFSLVTADQSTPVVKALGDTALNNIWFVDANSCSPITKKINAKLIQERGGRYVDMAIMAPVLPLKTQTPVLVATADAETLVADWLQPLKMQARAISHEIGKASSIKMIRSVVVKGMEALTAECLLAAEKAGVTDELMASIAHSHPSLDWPEKATYNFERMMRHGVRRAAEMREVERYLNALGFHNTITHAVIDWQQRIGELNATDTTGELKDITHTLLNDLDYIPPQEVL